MRIKETFIVELKRQDTYGTFYEEFVKLHYCTKLDGSYNQYFIEYNNGTLQKIDIILMNELLKDY